MQQHHPALAAAFHNEATFRVWGCAHENRLIGPMKAAYQLQRTWPSQPGGRPMPRDVFFWVKYGKGKLGAVNTTLDHLHNALLAWARGTRVNRNEEPRSDEQVGSYCGAAAQRQFARVFGAAPDMGANVGFVDGYLSQYIDLTTSGGPNKPPENRDPMKFLQGEFLDLIRLNEHNYLDYSSFLHADYVDPGWHTERCLMETGVAGEIVDDIDYSKSSTFITLPSSMLAICYDVVLAPPKPQPFTWKQRSGHLYVLPGLQLSRIDKRRANYCVWATRLRSESPRDSALLVDSTGRTTALRGDAVANVWHVHPDVEVHKAKYNGGWRWQGRWHPFFPKPETASVPIGVVSDGVIEQVEPRWYW